MEYFKNPKSAWIDFSPLLSAMLHLTIPTFFTILVEIIIPLVTTMMIGRLGEKYLAAGSLGGMIVNASGYSITFGMASALDMMCSHAFGSKGT
jgi:MATE family multidrug resistance protein